MDRKRRERGQREEMGSIVRIERERRGGGETRSELVTRITAEASECDRLADLIRD